MSLADGIRASSQQSHRVARAATEIPYLFPITYGVGEGPWRLSVALVAHVAAGERRAVAALARGASSTSSTGMAA